MTKVMLIFLKKKQKHQNTTIHTQVSDSTFYDFFFLIWIAS